MSIKQIRKHLARIILAFNVVAMMALWAVCLSTWVSPTLHPRLASAGLLFPVFLFIELCFVGIWLVIKPRWTWIPLAALLPCIGFVLDYCPLSLHNKKPKNCLKIVTWNTDGFGGVFSENRDSAKALVIDYLERCDADIICLQESSLSEVNNTNFINYMDSVGYEHENHLGLLFFSRLHILSADTIVYPSRIIDGHQMNSSCFYHLKYGGDSILLVNNHLESNHLEKNVKDEYSQSIEETEYDKLKESGHTIGGQLFESVVYRGAQADSLASFIDRHKGEHIIICGDFNDTPISYTYQRVSRLLTSAYRQSGRGIGVSYNQKWFFVRIDHIFISDNWKSYNTFVDNSSNVSDHYPLVSWLKMQ